MALGRPRRIRRHGFPGSTAVGPASFQMPLHQGNGFGGARLRQERVRHVGQLNASDTFILAVYLEPRFKTLLYRG